MKSGQIIRIIILWCTLSFLAGCTTPQPVLIDEQFWKDPNEKIGIVLVKGPEKGRLSEHINHIYIPMETSGGFQSGAAQGAIHGAVTGLLKYAFHNKIYQHVKIIPATRFQKIQKLFERELGNSGFHTTLYDPNLDFKDFAKTKKTKGAIQYDLSPVFQQLQCDLIVLLSLRNYGAIAYDLNLSPPDGFALVQGTMVDRDGRILWDSGEKFGLMKESSTKEWDSTPDCKQLTSAVDCAIESSKLFLLYNFFGHRLTDETRYEIGSMVKDLAPGCSTEEHEERMMSLRYLSAYKTVDGITASCKKPFNMYEDCNIWSGATRKIEFNGRTARVAGSEDGKIIMVMPFTMLTGDLEAKVREAACAVLLLFEENDIRVEEVIGMSAGPGIAGYYFKLDQDGYSLLKQHTLK